MIQQKPIKRFEISVQLAAFILTKQAGIVLRDYSKLPGEMFKYCAEAFYKN